MSSLFQISQYKIIALRAKFEIFPLFELGLFILYLKDVSCDWSTLLRGRNFPRQFDGIVIDVDICDDWRAWWT